MNGTELSSAIAKCLVVFPEHADELGDLDQALGDGDLGITVSLGAKAAREALALLPDTATPTEVVLACAKAFANANPSTMAALVAGALLAGSRVWGDAATIGSDDVSAFALAAAESISQRGKSQVGDKTILDAMFPAAEALRTSEPGPAALDAAIAAAEQGVISSKELQSRRGRASWLQDRSIGLQDPGATAYLRFLQSWKAANSDQGAELPAETTSDTEMKVH
ncbi:MULTISPECIES: DAK2 domain-containing protein [unclassified Rathayibacter]|jgi:dihydroxyacetone kinase-like protein|uniref:DAK2 domain-containing protein n=1 Tax=unclassified Rathayibacter TaxID=2609250 RepID=UPI000CE7FD28|nr:MULTISPECIES: DAK2 domain-containing protein [unclassified Rathayibacter]PPF37979.1 Dak phosphatase [Rathayibacter sp. AY1A3]PPG18181.1 Dak phosphatase [Rathayibacter sp. AY1C6]PPH89671.1 Dak phosphatase [Rathayibacter sp. AY1D5]QHF21733.1 DAK2 domain-containing protein [Rathayibacter sp. VKM Ac-2762]